MEATCDPSSAPPPYGNADGRQGSAGSLRFPSILPPVIFGAVYEHTEQ